LPVIPPPQVHGSSTFAVNSQKYREEAFPLAWTQKNGNATCAETSRGVATNQTTSIACSNLANTLFNDTIERELRSHDVVARNKGRNGGRQDLIADRVPTPTPQQAYWRANRLSALKNPETAANDRDMAGLLAVLLSSPAPW
jgi:hypothetical protein